MPTTVASTAGDASNLAGQRLLDEAYAFILVALILIQSYASKYPFSSTTTALRLAVRTLADDGQ
ncbi:uncharacterized protein ARMOST_22627 [Armillaria ostoyae]|uniref:Uncharacterized protein n=1 Tax=Armillaria ostoyae TaxID=47428 RepID=A0A284SDE4_ARMOS|nr:uncharacterized protein ARMOST_22627 [Armillaria ostoyae]